MRYLITGGCGFLGSNLAADAIARGHEVTVFDNLCRLGSARNLEWLKAKGPFTHVAGDIRDMNDVSRAVEKAAPEVVFHLAGQVAMTTSIDDPQRDFDINARGSFMLLNAVRKFAPAATVVYSSTNKVYGDLETLTYPEGPTRYTCAEHPNGFDESTPLDFRSPYGCSKGAADQYMLDFHRVWGLKTVVFRHSSMYGGRQFATYDQGWVGWFCAKAVEAMADKDASFTISGNGKQVRDLLHAADMVSLYNAAVANADRAAGNAFNIGGGMANSLSLLELFALLEELTGAKLKYTRLPPRQSDQKVFVADLTKARRLLGWEPRVSAREGVSDMVGWIRGGMK